MKHYDAAKKWSLQEMCLHIRCVKMTKTFKSETKKIWVCLNESIMVYEGAKFSLRRAVLTGVSSEPEVRLVEGRAPAGYMEKQLGDFLSRMAQA